MRACHIVPCRDKAKHLKLSVGSVLAQTHKVDVILSDQGSKDDTLEVLHRMKAQDKDNNIIILNCPLTDPVGMHGLNTHMNWIIANTDYDLYIMSSADDWAHPDRNKRVCEAYEKHRPGVVLTSMQFIEADGQVAGMSFHPEEDGFIDPLFCLDKLIGGSTSHAWDKAFWMGSQPINPISSYDGYLVLLATLTKGAYMIRDALHAFIKNVDPNNTGLEGVYRAAQGMEQKRIEELMHYQVLSGYITALEKMDEWGVKNDRVKLALYEQVIAKAAMWSRVRTELTLARVQPMSLKA